MTDGQYAAGTERIERVHIGERIPVLQTIGEQSKELNGIERSVTCPCGTRRNVRDMFQCFYCEVWFCKNCAKEHFGDRSQNTDTDDDLRTDGGRSTDDTNRIEEILGESYGDSVYSVEEDVVWVSGMNSNCVSVARRMAKELVHVHDIPTSLIHDDDAARFGGVQFRWGDSA